MSKNRGISKNLKTLAMVSAIASVSILGAFAPSMAQIYDNNLDVPFIGIKASLNSGLIAGQVGKQKLVNSQAMKVFYKERDNEPLWDDRGSNKHSAEEFMAVIEKSWMHGLNPENYYSARLRDLLNNSNFIKRAELELLLTDAFIRYVQDLSGMRVDVKGLRTDKKSWRQKRSVEDVLAMLSSGRSAEEIVKDIAPKGRTYRALQAELVRLSEEPEEDYNSVLPIRFSGILRLGDGHRSIPDIRLRLGAQQQTNNSYLYDDRLAAAVIKFQRENGLDADGIIGSNTLDVINRTKLDKMHQLIANMERLRWSGEARPEKFVIINVPSATLWAIDNNRVEFEMDVIVGKPVRPTESFVANIQGIRFNPNWTVPSTIKRFDMLPKLKADPDYFASKGIELFDGYGRNSKTIDPASVDWDNISRAELNKLRMVQVPGDDNALGRIRVLMQNKFNIYLHDTNHREIFEESEYRHLSSGCIRLRDPHKMAKFIMRDKKNWSNKAMIEVLDTLETTDIRLKKSIPVYVTHYTTWVDESGQVVYGPDIYKQDRKLIEKLAQIDGFAIPGYNTQSQVRSGRSKIASAK